MSLDTNERSQPTSANLLFPVLKPAPQLVVHRCHVNRMNLFNQIGIVALNVLGEYTGTEDKFSPTALHSVENQHAISSLHRNDGVNDLAFDINVDPRTAQLIRSLLSAKEAAIQAEDFDAAKQFKTAERQFQALGEQLAQLEISKRRAVRDEDYDRAKLLKHEIASLQRRIENALQQHNFKSPVNCYEDHHFCSPPLTPSVTQTNAASSSNIPRQPQPPQHPQPSQLELSCASKVAPEECASKTHVEYVENAVLTNSQTSLSSLCSPEPPSKPIHFYQREDSLNHNKNHGSHQSTAILSSRSPDSASDSSRGQPVVPEALDGVPNAAELPLPESFDDDAMTDAGIIATRAVLGEYRARCLLSKNWALREAALAKTRLLLYAGHWHNFEDLVHLCDIARLGVQDKITQVYITALALVVDITSKMDSIQPKSSINALSALEPLLVAIVAKLGENQPRLREKAVDTLSSLSHCSIIGPSRVAETVMNSLEIRRPPHNRWRPIATRLEFLKRLALNFGVQNRSSNVKESRALVIESVMKFVDRHGCALHTFEEVRTATKDLIVTVFVIASMADRTIYLDTFLTKLRPKQAKEYQIAIAQGLDEQNRQLQGNNFSGQVSSRQVSTPKGRIACVQTSSHTSNRDDELYFSVALFHSVFLASAFLNLVFRSQQSDDPEEDEFRDRIMKQLEDKAFSVQEAHEILLNHFGTVSQGDPKIENVLAEWVGTDVNSNEDPSRDQKLWKVATWLFQ